jgi:hypothetical protein
MDDEEWDMLLLLGHELDNASQEIESWMEDYWCETMADRKKLERWTAWAKGESCDRVKGK